MFVSLQLVVYNRCKLLRPNCKHLVTQTIWLQLKLFVRNGIIHGLIQMMLAKRMPFFEIFRQYYENVSTPQVKKYVE